MEGIRWSLRIRKPWKNGQPRYQNAIRSSWPSSRNVERSGALGEGSTFQTDALPNREIY